MYINPSQNYTYSADSNFYQPNSINYSNCYNSVGFLPYYTYMQPVAHDFNNNPNIFHYVPIYQGNNYTYINQNQYANDNLSPNVQNYNNNVQNISETTTSQIETNSNVLLQENVTVQNDTPKISENDLENKKQIDDGSTLIKPIQYNLNNLIL